MKTWILWIPLLLTPFIAELIINEHLYFYGLIACAVAGTQVLAVWPSPHRYRILAVILDLLGVTWVIWVLFLMHRKQDILVYNFWFIANHVYVDVLASTIALVAALNEQYGRKEIPKETPRKYPPPPPPEPGDDDWDPINVRDQMRNKK